MVIGRVTGVLCWSGKGLIKAGTDKIVRTADWLLVLVVVRGFNSDSVSHSLLFSFLLLVCSVVLSAVLSWGLYYTNAWVVSKALYGITLKGFPM